MMKMMKRLISLVSSVSLISMLGAATVYATPSTHIWAPSTDMQPYKVVHLTDDVYVPAAKDGAGTRVAPTINLGLTVGVLPFEKINMEVGFDVIQNGTAADANPVYYNLKVGTPENGLLKGFPAIAVGSYLIGTKSKVTDYNVMYGKVAKTVGNIGKVSAGFYSGNDKLLLDDKGKKANDGVLLCWERTMTEVSDKLWVAVDYMGGNNALGTLNVGFAWSFTPNISVILGYDMLNNRDLTGVADTVTTQLDINF